MDAGYVAAITGLVGAAIGSASSIVAMIIQSRVKDRRDRSKQVTDIALAEFRMHVDLAAAGHGPRSVLPISTFIFNMDQVLSALEKGELTGARLREIAAKNDEFEKAAIDIDRAQRGDGSNRGHAK